MLRVLLVGGFVCLLGLPEVVGQTENPKQFSGFARSARIRRPSSQAPSVFVGRQRGRRLATPSAGRPQPVLDTALLTGTGTGGGIGILPRGPIPMIAQPSRVFVNSSLVGVSTGGLMGTVRANTLANERVSGLSATTFLGRPLLPSPTLSGAPMQNIPLAPAAVPRPVEPASAYHGFFGIVPAAPERRRTDAVDPVFVDVPTFSDRLGARFREQLRVAEGRAVISFKTATDTRTTDLVRAQARAARELTNVSTLRRDLPSAIPLLLLAHLDLERDRITSAITHLAEAAERYPRVFLDHPDLRGYFGEERLFEAQLREYIRVGTQNPDSPEALVLEAYCAWQLGDNRRAAAALESAEEIAREQDFARPSQRAGVSRLIWALRAAVQE